MASCLKLDIPTNVDRTVQVRKVSRQLHLGLSVPSEVREAIKDSVTVRSIGKVKRRSSLGVGKTKDNSKLPRDRDNWILLSVRRSNIDAEIIAIDSPKYRDHVLVWHNYQLEKDCNNVTEHPKWLIPTQTRWNIKRDDILGYIGLRSPNGSISKLGIVHLKEVKKKREDGSKQHKTVIWFTLIEQYTTKQVNTIGFDSKDKEIQKTYKRVKNSLGVWEKREIINLIPVSKIQPILEQVKKEIDPEIIQFLSLYGLRHNTPIIPSKMNMINGQSKQLNVNWSSLTGLRLEPLNREGQVEYNPKYSCPFSVVY